MTSVWSQIELMIMADQKKTDTNTKRREKEKKRRSRRDIRFNLVPSAHEMNTNHSEIDSNHLRVNMLNI